MASWSREAASATIWSLLGLAAAALAGVVAVYVVVGYGLAFGKSSNWCNSPARLYRNAAALGLVALAAQLPGLWLLRRRLRGDTGRLAAVVTFGPLVFAAGSVLMAAAGHALRCVPSIPGGVTGPMASLNDAGAVGIVFAPVLLAFAAFAAAAIGSKLDEPGPGR